MTGIEEMIRIARERGASDIYIRNQVPPVFRIGGELRPYSQTAVEPSELLELLIELFSPEQRAEFEAQGDLMTAYQAADGGSCRICASRQLGLPALAVRILSTKLPAYETLEIPDKFRQVSAEKSGLLLLCGAAGSGRSTTAAALLDFWNKTRKVLIITCEKNVEYRHSQKESLVLQREYGRDFKSFAAGIEAALKQGADVIYADGIADRKGTEALLKAAKSGCLVLTSAYGNSPEEGVRQFLGQAVSKEHLPTIDSSSGPFLGVLFQTLLAKPGESGAKAAFTALCRGEERLERIWKELWNR